MFKESGLVVLSREGEFLLDVLVSARCQNLKGPTGDPWVVIM